MMCLIPQVLWRIHSIASAIWLKKAGEERRPNGRHLSTNHLPCQWMPRRCQSSLRTGSGEGRQGEGATKTLEAGTGGCPEPLGPPCRRAGCACHSVSVPPRPSSTSYLVRFLCGWLSRWCNSAGRTVLG